MKKYITTLEELRSFLYELFDALNYDIFEGEIPKPEIIVGVLKPNQSFRLTNPVWGYKSNITSELTINGDLFLNRTENSVDDIVITMLRGMVLIYCNKHQIKATSRGGTYYNKRFKSVAEAHGLKLKAKDANGCSQYRIDINSKAKSICDSFNKKIFIGRKSYVYGDSPLEKNGHYYKLICNKCGQIVRSTKRRHNVLCGNCLQNLLDDDVLQEFQMVQAN